jgi:hypothetical protein
VASGPLSATVVEQPLPDLFPAGAATIEADCIGGLDFDNAIATPTRHAQDVPRYFGQPAVLDRHA